MASTIRIKTRLYQGMVTLRALIRHPMETGFRFDNEKNGLVPAHYIKLVTIKHNGEVIMSCDWSRAVSKNPYLSFMFEGAKSGDSLELSWVDTEGQSDKATAVIE